MWTHAYVYLCLRRKSAAYDKKKSERVVSAACKVTDEFAKRFAL